MGMILVSQTILDFKPILSLFLNRKYELWMQGIRPEILSWVCAAF
jgi:hypothetical protein